MKKFLALSTALIMSFGLLSGCQSSSEPAAPAAETQKKEDGQKEEPENKEVSADAGKLVIYSPNSESMINVIIPLFEQETGIKVELISAGTGEVFKRVESEKANPYADVLFGGGRATYVNNKDLFEPYTAQANDDVMPEYQNIDGVITLYCLDGSCLLVNKDLIGDIKIEGYGDLLNPELKGMIATADPASSSSAFAQLTNILLAMGGDYTADEGWDYVKELLVNIDGKVASGSGAVHKSVADGEYIVALTYEDPSATYVRDGANVEVVYPTEGVVYLPAGAAIVKDAKNMENAKKFMDFIVSKTAQDAFGTQLTVRPVRADAELGDYMTPLEDINIIYEDYDYVQENKNTITEKYMELFTSN